MCLGQAATPLIHSGSMKQDEFNAPLQLMLLPTSHLPECLRLDVATRVAGLHHISELRAELERRRMKRRPSQPAA